MASLKQGAIGVYNWLEHRLGLFKPTMEAAAHPIPIKSESWLYVFGSAATILLGLQVVTGILLALVYTPSANEAWNTLHFLNNDIPLGWFLRAIHGWGSNFMVAIVLIHMCQVFLFGAYKFPRELTWIIGVFLLLLTLGMAFTGQVLRFDQDAYWGLGIGASILGRLPLIGGPAVSLMLGGPILGGATLSRFFALHVFVIPGILLAGVGVHVWMVLHLGINDWPMPGRIVRKATYEREYHQQTAKEGIPFVPDGAWKDGCFAAIIILAVVACALFFGPIGPSGQPDPRIIETAPKPDFFFLWIYAVLAYLPPSIETPVHVHRPNAGDRRDAPAAAGLWRGREALVTPPPRGTDACGGGGEPRSLHAARHLYTLEPDHGCVDEPTRFLPVTSTTGRRSNARGLSSSRTSNAATAIRLAASADCVAPRWMPWPLI